MDDYDSWRWLGIIAVILMAPVMAVWDGWTYWQVRTDGVQVTGSVTGRDTYMQRGNTRYTVSYRFRDGSGRTRHGSQTVPQDVYQRMTPGGSLWVVYSQSDPSANVADMKALYNRVAWFGFLSVVLGIVGACAAWAWHQARTNPDWRVA